MLGELNREQIESLLHGNVVGRIGCHDHRGTYVVPVTYVYDGDSIIGHTSPGRKIDMMRNNPQVCFEVDSVTNMANWQSVVAWGKFEELNGDEAVESMRKFADRLAPLMTSETARAEHVMNTDDLQEGEFRYIIYKIRLGKKTGRYEKR